MEKKNASSSLKCDAYSKNIEKIKGIYGAGLDSNQLEALAAYKTARYNLNPTNRTILDAELPMEFEDEQRRSKKFAFWMACTRIAQDRPIFFWGGLFILIVDIVRQIYLSLASLLS